ncbi:MULTISPECIES: hypothetical protein [unclassified Streptosporangium]|uniref:hypothetical protein n=1 Tax=unclassified Streptosporangium TaxID=2632669 RepID=UPI002E2BD3E2|nr:MULTISPECIES: hypothetical protein [unclassified Streptosporangium]
MSKQTSFTLMLLLAFSVIVPGSAGYLSVKMEELGQAHRELVTLENRIRDERLAARIKKVERTRRDRRLQPVIASDGEPCDPPGRSRDEPGTRSSGPAAVVPVPVADAGRPHEKRLRARRHVVQRHVPQAQNARERDARAPDTRGPGTPWQDVREPAEQRLTAQGRPGAGMTGEAAPLERWSQLERRGRRHQEGEAREEHASTAPDAVGVESPPEGTGASPGEGSPPGPSQTGTRAN